MTRNLILIAIALAVASYVDAASRFHDLPESPHLRAIDRMLTLQLIGLSEHLMALPANECKAELARLAMDRSAGWEAGAAQFAARDIFDRVLQPDRIQDLGHDEAWIKDMGGAENAARYQGNLAMLALHLKSHRHELSLYKEEVRRRAAQFSPDVFTLNADEIENHLVTIGKIQSGLRVPTYPDNAKLKSYNLPGRRYVPRKPGKPD